MDKILRIDVMILDDKAQRSMMYFGSIDEFTSWLREEARK